MSEEATAWGKRGRSFLTEAKVQTALGTGVSDIAAASKAVAAGVGSGQFSVDPETVDRMVKKLMEMKDALMDVMRSRRQLTIDTKLGSGYAEVISENNKRVGETATQHVTDLSKALDSLIEQLKKSQATYQNADQAQADSLNKLNGK
ncbi:hypothetical protein [Lentzea sp. NPDC003310]|uniref:hypothetical protein n=1 Tax=Lentzea sp. NPDC003310 TaxID=3154447 RepID=UPI0033A58728